MNTITITGNLTGKPDFYEGESFCKTTFRIADNYYQGKNKESGTNFMRCVLIGNYAKTIHEVANKGTQLTVYGELRTDTYENENGEPMKSMYVFANNVSLPRIVENAKD